MQSRKTSQELENASFSPALRGYDKSEVDAFLHGLAGRVRQLEEAAEKPYRGLGEDMGNLLQHARDSADEIVATATAEAEKLAAEAASAAQETRAEADADARKMRDEAQSDAAGARAEAKKDADDTRAAARAEAERRIEDAADRVRRLQALEQETRSRVGELRARLAALAERLEPLETSGGDLRLVDSIAGNGREDAAASTSDEVTVALDARAEEPAH